MKQITPKEAHAFLQANPEALLIDVRSEIEYLFVGHPVGAIHVSWNDGPEWEVNPHFVGEVRKLAGNGGGRPILLICRSGNRSEVAARPCSRPVSKTSTTCSTASKASSTNTTTAIR